MYIHIYISILIYMYIYIYVYIYVYVCIYIYVSEFFPVTHELVQNLSYFNFITSPCPSPKLSLNTEKNMLNKMTLGHLSHFNEIYSYSRTHQVLSNYIVMLGFFFVSHCVWSFQVYMFNSTAADISRFWNILGILEPFAFSVVLFCHPFGGRDSQKYE